MTRRTLINKGGVRLTTLLELKDIKTYFYLDEGTVKSVDGVSFSIDKGKTLGVVGESGCGKSVTAQSILQIVPQPGRIIQGEIIRGGTLCTLSFWQGTQTERGHVGTC